MLLCKELPIEEVYVHCIGIRLPAYSFWGTLPSMSNIGDTARLIDKIFDKGTPQCTCAMQRDGIHGMCACTVGLRRVGVCCGCVYLWMLKLLRRLGSLSGGTHKVSVVRLHGLFIVLRKQSCFGNSRWRRRPSVYPSTPSFVVLPCAYIGLMLRS